MIRNVPKAGVEASTAVREAADCIAVAVVVVVVAACCMLPLHDWQQQTRMVCNVSWAARLEHILCHRSPRRLSLNKQH